MKGEFMKKSDRTQTSRVGYKTRYGILLLFRVRNRPAGIAKMPPTYYVPHLCKALFPIQKQCCCLLFCHFRAMWDYIALHTATLQQAAEKHLLSLWFGTVVTDTSKKEILLKTSCRDMGQRQ